VPEFKINTPILEDCCEAMGGCIHGKMMGTMGIAGAFSMYPSHTITTGEGGLIITNDDQFYKIANSIHNHGKIANDFDFSYVGINAKMTNLQAAIGCAIFDSIDDVNHARMRNVDLYNENLGLEFFAEAPHCYPVIYPSRAGRDEALVILDGHGIEARKLMSCVPMLSFYAKKGYPLEVIEKCCDVESFPVAERLASCGLFLPVHQKLKWSDIDYVCEILPKP
jgi:perosamine synthetase